jgi:hypothetical protein
MLQRTCAPCQQKEDEARPLQRFAARSGIAIGPADDVHEREADRITSAVLGGRFAPVQGRLGEGEGAEAPAIVEEVLRTGGSPLDPAARGLAEEHMSFDFGGIRIHGDGKADASARAVDALAYTVGRHIVFRAGHYAPETEQGQRLLVHELAHACQQGAAPRKDHKPARIATASVLQRQAAGAAAPLAPRLAAFRRLVKNSGKLRLSENGRALEQWRQFLAQRLTPAEVRSQVHAEEVRALLSYASQTGELSLAEQWLRTQGPNRRWVLQQQIEGRFHACTGCHATVQAEAMDRARAAAGFADVAPLQRFAGGTGGGARPSFAEAEHVATNAPAGLYPAVQQAEQRVNAARPYLRQLGREGFRVLPEETLGSTAPPAALMADIAGRIAQRQADYRTLSQRIDAPDFDYLQLRPIVRDLLPLADADVRHSVEDAIRSAETWETIESIVIGAATIGLLLLAIFPPTSAIGIAGALALGTAVGAHQAYRGYESFEQGRLFALGRGAHDVLDPAQQEAAESLMAMGALNMVLGSIGVASGALGGVRLIRSLPSSGAAVGTLQAVEGRAGGNVYRVTGWGTSDPQVAITNPAGQVIREGPLSSFRPGASGTPTAASRVGTAGYVYPTEGGAARVAQPVPVAEPIPAPRPVARPVPAPVAQPPAAAPSVQGPLAVMAATGAPGAARRPVMPPGLSLADRRLWQACNDLHETYKATQAEAAGYSPRMDPIAERAHQNRATPQDRVDLCNLLDERIRVMQRLHAQRLQYLNLGCDKFDWFNMGLTQAERAAAHGEELDNVARALNNLYELRSDFCPPFQGRRDRRR